MSLYKKLSENNKHIELLMCDSMTFESISSTKTMQLLTALKKKHPTQLTIDCSEIANIDSCGLALLIYIIKSLPNTKTKLLSTSTKLEKLRALYLSTNDHL